MLLAVLVMQAAAILTTAQTGEFLLRAPGASTTAQLREDGITGPTIQVSWSGASLRGRADGRPIELTSEKGTITGSAPGQVNLRILPLEHGIRLQGAFAARISDLRLTAQTIEGSLGRCAYTLRASGNEYDGNRTCFGQAPEPVRVRLPARLLEQPLAQTAAELAVLLGR
jgi:hypothetical protein